MKKINKKINKTSDSELFIPALCLMIVFSALLVLQKKTVKIIPESLVSVPVLQQVSVTPTPGAFLSFVPSVVTLKKSEETSVKLQFTPKKEFSLDGIDLLLSFDPTMVSVTKVVPEKLFSFSSFQSEHLSQGRISATFLEEKKDGVVLKDQSFLLTLFLKARKPGNSEISVVLSEEGPSTVIIQTNTSQKIQFESQKLLILNQE